MLRISLLSAKNVCKFSAFHDMLALCKVSTRFEHVVQRYISEEFTPFQRQDLKNLLRIRSLENFKTAQKNKEFREACKHGYIHTIRFLNVSVKSLHAYKSRALVNACEGGHYDVVKYILSRSTNVYTGFEHVLVDICLGKNRVDIAELVWNKLDMHAFYPVSENSTGFTKHVSSLKWLHEKINILTNVNSEWYICEIVKSLNLEVIKYYVENIDVSKSFPTQYFYLAFPNLECMKYLHSKYQVNDDVENILGKEIFEIPALQIHFEENIKWVLENFTMSQQSAAVIAVPFMLDGNREIINILNRKYNLNF